MPVKFGAVLKRKYVVSPGDVFGRWTVIAEVPQPVGGARILCRCACGTERLLVRAALAKGKTKSCGVCIYHHKNRTPTHTSWTSMTARCRNPALREYKDYGGRGIKVCDRWLIFENFLADMGERPEGMTLGRIDNDADYTPENCRWETAAQQTRNRRSSKLTEDDVREIRRRMAAGEKQADVARAFGVRDSQVFRVRNHLQWAQP